MDSLLPLADELAGYLNSWREEYELGTLEPEA